MEKEHVHSYPFKQRMAAHHQEVGLLTFTAQLDTVGFSTNASLVLHMELQDLKVIHMSSQFPVKDLHCTSQDDI